MRESVCIYVCVCMCMYVCVYVCVCGMTLLSVLSRFAELRFHGQASRRISHAGPGAAVCVRLALVIAVFLRYIIISRLNSNCCGKQK